MSTTVLGGLLGLVFAVGVLATVAWSPPRRRARLADRLRPYVADAARPSRLLGAAPDGRTGLLVAAGRVGRPVLTEAAVLVGRLAGGSQTIRRRLAAAGSDRTLEDFRIEQVVWGFAGVPLGAAAGALLSTMGGSPSPLAIVLLAVTGLFGGVLGRDWWLSAQVRRREERMVTEFPVVAELLALAVTAGEAPATALDRVCRLCGGELSRELGIALAQARAGMPLPVALAGVADRTSLDTLARFVDGMVVAIERGTPLADVLRSQAADVREAGKRALLAAGGRREIAMMFPVVFLILPVTVLFALYPGLVNLTVLAR